MQPKIYPVDEHKIAPDKIDTHAFYVIQKLRQAGHKAYLVGGGVRDLLLGACPKDFDVSTSAKPEEIKALFRNAILIGRRFRLAHIRFGKKVIEVSTFRSGATEEAGLIVRDNEWGSEEQDVLRRDFTINGLFYDPESQKVIDYVDGYPDLEKKILRTIGKPDIRFTQDPVRMIRLIKFCARFNFEIHHPTFEALLSCKGEILKSSQARIFEELLRMLESGSSKAFFHLLNEYGLLKALSQPMAVYLDRPNNVSLQLLSAIDDEVRKNVPLDRSFLLAALIFPLFQENVMERSKRETLHLGQIAEMAHRTIDQVFHPFFNIPRRMRGIMGFIMTAQFRLVPLDGKVRKPRPPRDPFFPHALHLLKLRASIDPTLLPHYTLWTEASFDAHELAELPPKRRRRKRRRRRGNEEPV
ncbi:MAG: polynucleotide adenylyltransferase PcnB [Verrucomicrobia bacterium]|nr:polynucleotide adenylyltransferase PcnB [Verrucomicrobiota bacterium]MBU6446054.1 polynucleotide adenylyltransferase PcnB [Verrucomicrobiota bacterium]MDE3046955.1 polynucleotide adenylyltransferase PcnB [Verrucomicrobiota bacterium]